MISVLTGAVYRGARPLPGFALGDAAADPYAAASVRLSELLAQVYNAKKLIDGQQFTQAINTMKGIGNDAAANLGPQIDRGPQPAATQPWTGDAWSINGQLASIATTDGAAGARAAADAIDRMMADYSTAINKAHAAMGIAPRTEQPATWPYVLFAGTVLAAGGTALYLVLRK